jgi:hypothetical protein
MCFVAAAIKGGGHQGKKDFRAAVDEWPFSRRRRGR